MSRRDELAAGLARVEQRIRTACDASGRDRTEITLVVVTKTYPASDVALLVDLGVTDVGENRHPEAQRKMDELIRMGGDPPRQPTQHFLGGLQTNKAGAVARYADVVHSVDRARLVEGLSRGAQTAGRTLTCLVQVDFGEADGRSGAAPGDVPALADQVAAAPGLRLGGLMTVAPLGVDPGPHFAHLSRLCDALRLRHPDAAMVSAGMSQDLEAAIVHGATHLRVGSAILGQRPTLR